MVSSNYYISKLGSYGFSLLEYVTHQKLFMGAKYGVKIEFKNRTNLFISFNSDKEVDEEFNAINDFLKNVK